jgi:hypothetical protein
MLSQVVRRGREDEGRCQWMDEEEEVKDTIFSGTAAHVNYKLY